VKVVVVHPDPALGAQAHGLLSPLGHLVVAAPDGPSGLELCRAQAPDVVLAHPAMQTADGLALLDAIKRDIDLFPSAVVLVSAVLDAGETAAALRRGAQDVLREPVDPAELVARLQAAARTKTLQEELSEQSRRLESLIFGDELTGAFNRRFLLTQLAALVSGAKRHERPLSVVMVDIDHFKQVNDEHGHAAGDAVIAAVAHTIRDRLRQEDWVGRLGGEEFLALLPDDGADGAATVAEGLRTAIEHMGVRTGNDLLRITVSVGWATLEHDEDADSLIRRADDALYAAKRSGRNVTRGAATLRRRI